ncbi:MAG: hypothetical protein ABIZ36_13950 [Gemmatimonadaceae bacterium]
MKIQTPDLPAYASLPIGLVGSRVGKYDLYASKSGYAPWVIRGLAVRQGACGAVQVKVTANLQRQGT